ncbi:MAG: hypothetical protein KA314_05125 [Chloroflexi bacterium]|nr:hypothetical protein [Chloroflexota bacterium]
MGKRIIGNAAAMVAFQWMGSRVGIRILEGYIWDSNNNYIQAVDVDMAAKLLTYPIDGEFMPVGGQEISQETLQQLANLCGGTVDEVRVLLGVNHVIAGDEMVGE